MPPTDPHQGANVELDSPGIRDFDITPSDEDDLAEYTRAIYVGSGGDVNLVLQGNRGAAARLYTNVPDGTLLPLRVRRVMSTSTTASEIVGIV